MNNNITIDKIFTAAESYRSIMLKAERFIWQHPETGFREWQTSAYLKAEFEKLGYVLSVAGDIPGFYTDVDTKRPGPKLVIFAEMDSLIVAEHPECDAETGYVHACGHNAQCAALLGCAAVLKDAEFVDKLSGSIRFCIVPAEELIEIQYREQLRRQGLIHYYGGKIEFLYRGYLDDADLALMVHTTSSKTNSPSFSIDQGCNGCIAKTINFKGVSSHAGGGPHLGVNALYEASLALQAANSLRETFKDHEHIRFHPVITQSSGVVNAIPDNIILESFVRGANHDAIVRENKKINRAMAACAAAFGGNVILKDCPGYMPLKNSQAMSDIIFEAIGDAFGHDSITYGGWNTASTDMGDISQIMPVVHPYCSGASGSGHAANYVISDPETAVITSCKMQLVMINSLLSNGAVNALDVMKSFKPSFTKEQLLKALDDMFIELKAVTYNDDGTILLNF